jgi:tetratricopeptide (TPR) repeat protein
VVFILFLLLAAPATFEETFRAGLLALQRSDLNAAQTNLEAAAKLEPANGRVWVALSQTYWKLKENVKADAAAAKAESLGPRDPLVLSSLAIFYAGSGQALKAAGAQARYSSLVPQDAAARERAESLYFEAAQPLLQQGKFAEAIPILNAGTKNLKSSSAQLELALGVAYYGLRRFDDAAEAFLRTIAIAPEIEQPYVFLGKFLDQIPLRLPELTKKFIEYETANPSKSVAYYLHAKALNAQSAEPETARKLLEKALAINELDPAAHFELGAVFDRTHRYPDAAREFERAAELAPNDAATHYRLSRIYDRLGKPDAAQLERERHAKLEKAERSGAAR